MCCNSYKLKTHLASSLLLMKSRAMKVPTTATTNTALSTVDGDRDILLLQLCRTPKPSLAISQSDSVTLPQMRADQRDITSFFRTLTLLDMVSLGTLHSLASKGQQRIVLNGLSVRTPLRHHDDAVRLFLRPPSARSVSEK